MVDAKNVTKGNLTHPRDTMRPWTGKISLFPNNSYTYFFSVDDFCGYLNLIRMLNKTSLQHALLALILTVLPRTP